MVDKMSAKSETIVYSIEGISQFTKDGRFFDLPEGWEFVPSGDPALTRRLKAAATEYWIVKRFFGRKEFNVGLCVPNDLVADIAE